MPFPVLLTCSTAASAGEYAERCVEWICECRAGLTAGEVEESCRQGNIGCNYRCSPIRYKVVPRETTPIAIVGEWKKQ
ncbi:hypothetical protein MIND_01112900 [Mycena indigotica]|uniref:Uncharacterized protein n=1 Tax=Mycena indigotica TaxID=2126181 RepID=A0A8H6SA87_9AGAR|nr:uncharacterized protein MIND_01112900 [Mycena indigotica]KAF7295723.1 hypothetical protein MIND_01112900 [Mycena indigotica]